jgi:hypothetical protein
MLVRLIEGQPLEEQMASLRPRLLIRASTG